MNKISDLDRLMMSLRDLEKRGIFGLSTEHALAAAFVLNRMDWLSDRGFTLAEAVELIGPRWLSLIPDAAKLWSSEKTAEATTLDVLAKARNAAGARRQPPAAQEAAEDLVYTLLKPTSGEALASGYAVRTLEFIDSNVQWDGSLLWPELLLVGTHSEAEGLCRFLNKQSFEDDWEETREEEPDLTLEDAKLRWRIQDDYVYKVVSASELSEDDFLERTPGSIRCCRNLFPELFESGRLVAQ